jgi:predicted alpha/beta-hydrolase family hydrolase
MLTMKQYTFLASNTKGTTSAIHQTAQKPIARFVMGHGAGANMSHAHMQSLADALANNGIDTLRYNFPFMEAGGGRVDNLTICLDTIENALALCSSLPEKLPTFLCGHSFGGRMSSHFAAERQPEIAGIVYFSFPLHPSKKPDTKRATHLKDIQLPQLFVSGSRDTLAEMELLAPIIESLPNAALHEIETADHSFKILKRTRKSTEDVYIEAGRVAKSFVLACL